MAEALGQLRFLGDSTYRAACSGIYTRRRLAPFVKSALRCAYTREVDERRARQAKSVSHNRSAARNGVQAAAIARSSSHCHSARCEAASDEFARIRARCARGRRATRREDAAR